MEQLTSCHPKGVFLALAQKDGASVVIPSYKVLIGFPTGETAINVQNTRLIWVPVSTSQRKIVQF